jgi:type I restriction enzyme R subunit
MAYLSALTFELPLAWPWKVVVLSIYGAIFFVIAYIWDLFGIRAVRAARLFGEHVEAAKAKAFLRTYGFLSSILPYTNADWEKLSIFLTFLVPKLPAPIEEDLSKGILEAIDMDSYRVEKQAAIKIQLPDADAEIEPVPTTGGGRKPEPELDRLSNILKTFNDQFGNIPWSDSDRVHKLITEDIPNRVAADTAYRNAKQNSDKQNARIEHDKALARVMTAVLKDDTELFKQFMDNESFRRWLTDTVFGLTYESSPSRR